MKDLARDSLEEQVLNAWIILNALLKDSRMTQSLTYNEAIILKLIYDDYQKEKDARTAVQQLLNATHFLKSLMNRTIDSLCSQGYIKKERDGRNLYVRMVPEKIKDFLEVHNCSLEMVKRAIEVIGEEDARAFVRLCTKLSEANIKP